MKFQKKLKAERRKRRIRGKIRGTKLKPRLSVFRSHRYLYAQLIDDEKGRTLVSAGPKDIGAMPEKKGLEKAWAVGDVLAKKALKKGIKKVVFSRGPYSYHGQVKALAEGARKGGLEF